MPEVWAAASFYNQGFRFSSLSAKAHPCPSLFQPARWEEAGVGSEAEGPPRRRVRTHTCEHGCVRVYGKAL